MARQRTVLALAMALAALCYSVGFVGQGMQPTGRVPQTAARAEAKKAPKKKAKAQGIRNRLPFCDQLSWLSCSSMTLPGTLGGPEEGLLGEDFATRVLLVPAAWSGCASWLFCTIIRWLQSPCSGPVLWMVPAQERESKARSEVPGDSEV